MMYYDEKEIFFDHVDFALRKKKRTHWLDSTHIHHVRFSVRISLHC
jgi:hypothetical protein